VSGSQDLIARVLEDDELESVILDFSSKRLLARPTRPRPTRSGVVELSLTDRDAGRAGRETCTCQETPVHAPVHTLRTSKCL
jgi:hypothetical protein